MTATIRTLCATGLFFGVSMFASPSAATAQGKGRGHAVEQKVQKPETKVQEQVKEEQKDNKVEQKAISHAAGKPIGRKAGRSAARRSTLARRERVLCADGTWSTAGRASCDSHGGLAARYTVTTKSPPPRASERARERASTRSAVYRGTLSNTNSTGAIARCNDGTYWHSTTRVNACSGHDGVRTWL